MDALSGLATLGHLSQGEARGMTNEVFNRRSEVPRPMGKSVHIDVGRHALMQPTLTANTRRGDPA